MRNFPFFAALLAMTGGMTDGYAPLAHPLLDPEPEPPDPNEPHPGPSLDTQRAAWADRRRLERVARLEAKRVDHNKPTPEVKKARKQKTRARRNKRGRR